MFIKIPMIALALLVGVTSGAFAATKHKQTSSSPGAFAATDNPAPMGWRNPSFVGAHPNPNTQGYLCLCD